METPAPIAVPSEDLHQRIARMEDDNADLRILRDKLQGEIDALQRQLQLQQIASLRAFSQYDAELSALRGDLAAARVALMPPEVAPPPKQ